MHQLSSLGFIAARLQADLEKAVAEQQRLQAATQAAEQGAAMAEAAAQAARKERDSGLKQAKGEAARREADMLAKHTSEARLHCCRGGGGGAVAGCRHTAGSSSPSV